MQTCPWQTLLATTNVALTCCTVCKATTAKQRFEFQTEFFSHVFFFFLLTIFSPLSYSDAAFTDGKTIHQNPNSFHDRVTNMEALVRRLKAYYEVNFFAHYSFVWVYLLNNARAFTRALAQVQT